MSFHKNVTATDVHVVYAFTYGNSSARASATGLIATDVGKVAWQTDDHSFWVLVNHSPVLWASMGEVTGSAAASMAAHLAALDPHPQYLLVAETNLLYEVSGTFATGIANHLSAPDPHAQYLLTSEGNTLYEVTGTASSTMALHLAASDPHPGYLLTSEGDAAYVPLVRTVSAGAGLVGGGALTGNLTLNVAANADASIVVNSDDIQVGVLATDAQHGSRGGGTQHSVVIANGASGFMSGSDKAKLDSVSVSASVITVTATGPVTSSGGQSPSISMPAATTTISGYFLASDKAKLDSISVSASVITATATAPLTSSGGQSPNFTIPSASATISGYMLASSQAKLDGIEAGAQVNTVTSVFGRSGIVVAASGDYTPAQVGAELSGTAMLLHLAASDPHTQYLTSTEGDAAYVPLARTITAGAGLTGSGDLSANRTLDVCGNADGSIIVNANDVQVGVLATDAQHGLRGGGTQHSIATTSSAGFIAASDMVNLHTVVSAAVSTGSGGSGTVKVVEIDFDQVVGSSTSATVGKGRMIDMSRYPTVSGFTRTMLWEGSLQSSVNLTYTQAKLYDLTSNAYVSGTTVDNTGSIDQSLLSTFSVTPVTGTLTGTIRTDYAHAYELHVLRLSGTFADLVKANARVTILYV